MTKTLKEQTDEARADRLDKENREFKATLLEVRKALEEGRRGDALKLIRTATQTASPTIAVPPTGRAA